ncbi:MAG: hypothetical protein H3C53_11160 [Trueperaceae bacterium]|nr:hypothetical protein [Trueperaceae bacterium]
MDARVANGQALSIDALWEGVARQCAYLRSRRDLLHAHTHYHWWPATFT